MDIHKPKPVHGLREFLKEYAIIVVGVLTALGAEQVVVAVHEQRIAEEARESVRAEVRENLWWVEWRESRQACVRQTIDALGDVLGRARDGRPYPAPQRIPRLGHSKLTTLRWQANAQAGRASLFTAQEQRYLGNVYYATEQVARAQGDQDDSWAKLQAMQGLDQLTPREVDEFAMLLAQVRYQNYRLEANARRTHQWAAALHLTADDPNQGEVAAAPAPRTQCVSITAANAGPLDDDPV